MDNPSSAPSPFTRRAFIKAGAALGALSALPLVAQRPTGAVAGSDRLRIGLVGCGGRGIGAVRDCIQAHPSVQLVAIGDAFGDFVNNAFEDFTKGRTGQWPTKPLPAEQMALTRERCFTGFKAYEQVMDAGIDLVLLCTPPHFRPMHMEAAVNRGLHIFAEKPVAVDPVGARRVIAVGELAEQKRLAIVAGTQRRHAANYLETMKRIEDGAIGDVVSGQCYWLQEGLWHRGRQPEWSEMEYQMRNWLYFTWLSGDHIVEQHIHNIDIMNWALGGPPVKALGMGGRQSRTDPKYGDAYDHFAIEFEYANGVRVQSMCRQVPGASQRVGERLVGTRGSADPAGTITGDKAWRYSGPEVNSMVQEHVDLIQSIRNGQPINHARRIAESTLTAILGRMSAYTGRELNFSWLLNRSAQDLTPPRYEFGEAPAVTIPVPGQTPVV
jgi:myo-inositol 2-dehydrogenase / D-chiro-inositol 1-dehydrogenase